eukprot:CAMPEP_0115015836 /NCGR_PEP_ID=MMETSP0216-20121206/27031_1 /TAXON_ID=223996 /ORGANISM="Protocruzia adherens, Strain Boccale" /LENGTH=1073 /DNA_ID=CAMNT_0002386083 /DNA_START=91 /DNA_END=3309 /DNA_ORIENTATION=+
MVPNLVFSPALRTPGNLQKITLILAIVAIMSQLAVSNSDMNQNFRMLDDTLSEDYEYPIVTPFFKHSAPDGKLVYPLPQTQKLVVAFVGGGFVIYDLKSHKPLHTVEGWLTVNVTSLTADSEETELYIGFDNSSLIVFDLSLGSMKRHITVSQEGYPVSAIAVSKDGNKLAVGCGKSIHVWETKSWSSLKEWSNPWHTVDQLVFSKDGSVLYTLLFFELGQLIVDSMTYTKIRSLSRDCSFVKLSPDGRNLAQRLRFTGEFQVVELLSNKVIQEVTAADSLVSSAFFSRDGTRLVTWGEEAPIKIFSVQSGKMVHHKSRGKHQLIPLSLFQSARPDHADINLLTVDENGKIQVTQLGETPKVANISRDANSKPRRIALSADGSTIVTANTNAVFQIFNAETGELLNTFPIKHDGKSMTEIYAYTLSKSGNELIVTGDIPGIHVWDFISASESYVLNTSNEKEGDGSIISLTLDSNGEILATGTSEGAIATWNLSKQATEHKMERESKSGIRYLQFSPLRTDDLLLAITEDNTVEAWAIEKRSLLITIEPKYSRVEAMAVTHDGSSVILSGPYDPTTMWSIDTGEYLKTVDKHKRGITSLHLTSDGTKLIMSGTNTELTFFDMETSSPVRQIGDKQMSFTSVAVNSKDTYLASTTTRGLVAMSLNWSATTPDATKKCDSTKSQFLDPYSQQCTTVCPPGFLKDPKTTQCTPFCSSNTFAIVSEGTCRSTCKGNYLGNPLNSHCVAHCPDRTWKLTSQNQCVPICPQGTYGDGDSKQCTPTCTLPKHADHLSRTCKNDCAQGSYLHEDSNSCVLACPKGKFQHRFGSKCESECWCGIADSSDECVATCDLVLPDYDKGSCPVNKLGMFLMIAGIMFGSGFVLFTVAAFIGAYKVDGSHMSSGRGTVWKVLLLVVLPVGNFLAIFVYLLAAEFSKEWLRLVGWAVILFISLIKTRSDIAKGHGLVWTPVRAGLKVARSRISFTQGADDTEAQELIGSSSSGYYLNRTVSAFTASLSYLFLLAFGCLVLLIALFFQWFLSWGRADLAFASRNTGDNSQRDFSPRGEMLAGKATKVLW